MLSGSVRTSVENQKQTDPTLVNEKEGISRKRLDSLDTLSFVAESSSGNPLSLLLPTSNLETKQTGFLPTWGVPTNLFDVSTPVASHTTRNARSSSFSSAVSNSSARSETYSPPLILPFACPPHLYSKEGRIGAYHKVGERATVLARFMEKRAKRRFAKRVRYDCRKDLADIRIRVKGRFIKAEHSLNIAVAVATSHSEIASEETMAAAAAADLAMLPSSSSPKDLVPQAPSTITASATNEASPVVTHDTAIETQEQLRNAFVPMAALSGDAIRRAFEKVEAKRLAAASMSPQPRDATPRIRSHSGDFASDGNTRSRKRTMSTSFE